MSWEGSQKSVMYNRFLSTLLFLICINFFVSTQSIPSPTPDSGNALNDTISSTPKPDELNLDDAKRTLKYGVSSSVISILKQASKTKDGRIKIEAKELLDNPSDGIVTAALEYFKALEDSSLADVIVLRLENFPDNSNTMNAALLDFLSQKFVDDSPSIHTTIRKILDSPRKEIQVQAIKVLSLKGNSQDADLLVDLFKDADTSQATRQSIITALGSISSPKSLEFIRSILDDDNEEKEIRNLAITSAGKLGDVESLPMIQKFMQDKDSVQRRGSAIQALEGFPISSVSKLYFVALRDDFWRNRLSAIRSIADKKYQEFIDPIMYIAEKDPEIPVRQEALRYLSVINTTTTNEALKKIIMDDKTSSSIRVSAIDLLMGSNLSYISDDLVVLLKKEWDNTKSEIIPGIGRKLSSCKDPAGKKIAQVLLGHKDPSMIISAIRWIQLNKAVEFIPDLETLGKQGGVIKSNAENALKELH